MKYSSAFFCLILLFFLISCKEELNISVSGTVIDIDTQEPVVNIKVQMRDGSAQGHNAPTPVLTATLTNSEGKYSLHYTDKDYSSEIDCIDNHLIYY